MTISGRLSGDGGSPGPPLTAGTAVLAAALLLVAGPVVGTSSAAQEGDDFPHAEHTGLFPLCTGCHEAAESGEPGEMYPEPADCAECHDGQEEEKVDWRGPSERASQLDFDHPEHARVVRTEGASEEPIPCSGCHTEDGAPRMAVERPLPARCLDCHTHRAEDHYVDAACSTCHLPLAETRLPGDRIADLPEPATHEDPEFLARIHGEGVEADPAACATCHTRERCTTCHVDPEGVEAVARMARAPEGMELPPYEARYGAPASHERDDWLEVHGRERIRPADCSTCHTRESCTTCHVEDAPAAATALPARGEVEAPGVDVERQEPGSHESPFFAEDHGTTAAAGGASCTACHAPSTCTECHEADRSPGYHPPNFAQQHASRAYGREMECANCHDSSVFCRDCHAQLGMESRGRLGGGFHDGTPAWLLRHGQAARQGLESCASCHQQRDCLQCHSETGAFQVSPHGPDFDARRLFDKNPQICFACHTSDPLDGSRP